MLSTVLTFLAGAVCASIFNFALKKFFNREDEDWRVYVGRCEYVWTSLRMKHSPDEVHHQGYYSRSSEKMNIASYQTIYRFWGNGKNVAHDVTRGEYPVDMGAGKGSVIFSIRSFRFDDFTIVFNNGKLIGARYDSKHEDRILGYRVPSAQCGFTNHNKQMLQNVHLFGLQTADRDELNRFVYGELAKISMARMEKMLLGKG